MLIRKIIEIACAIPPALRNPIDQVCPKSEHQKCQFVFARTLSLKKSPGAGITAPGDAIKDHIKQVIL